MPNNLTQQAGSYIGTIESFSKSAKPFTRTTPIWIYNKDEQLKLIIDPKGDIPHYDSWYTEQLNGLINLEFTVPASHPDVSFIENDGRAVIRDQDGDLIEFIIREPSDSNGSNGPVKEIFAEGGDYELIDEWLTGYKADNVALSTALGAVLSGTRISAGEVGDFGTQSVDIGSTSVKNAVHQLINLFGGERRHRVEAVGNQISERYLDVLPRRGQSKGKRFEHGKDTESISRIVDSTGIKTSLYGHGASGENDNPRINFGNIAWSKSNGDPADKPLGQTWIGDEEALQQWGYAQGSRHRFGEYSGQESDPAELLLNTWNHLQTLNKPITTYDIKVALLEKIKGYEHEKVRLGDTVLGIDREIQPKIEMEAAIIEYKQNLNDDRLDEVTLGNFRKTFDAARHIRDVEQVIERDRGKWDAKETTAGAQSKADVALTTAQGKIDDANLRIDQAKTDITNAQATIDSVTSEDTAGVTVLNGTLITNEIIAENAILTGTITGSNAVIQNATFENVTISGTLSSVDGTFTGNLVGASISSGSTIDVDTDLRVGDNIFLGNQSDYTTAKSLIFNTSARIQSTTYGYAGLQVSASTFWVDEGDVVLGYTGSSTTVQGDLTVDGAINGTASNATNLGNTHYTNYSLTSHNHYGVYSRITGSNDIWFELTSSNSLNVFKNGAYVRTI